MIERLAPTVASDAFVLLLFALWGLSRYAGSLHSLERLAARAAGSGRRAITLAAAITFLLAAAVSAVRPAVPEIQDEHSYLLAADTFAHGRLTNSTHPMWRHFESPHVLQQPSYQSKYPPAQGGSLALGRILTGSALVGVWLQMAAAAAALCWALLAWLRPAWALFGALLPAVRFGYFLWDAELSWAYWSASYWGGGAALLGGALLLGAVPRLIRTARPRDSVSLGLGLALLASSRPYEGFLVAVVACSYLGFSLLRSRQWLGALRTLLPGIAVAVSGLVLLGVYHQAVTGDPLTPPHQEYSRQYQRLGPFIFSASAEPERPPEGRIGRHHSEFAQARLAVRGGRLGIPSIAIQLLVGFFLGAALLLPLLALPSTLHRPGVRLALALCGIAILAHLPTTTSNVHPHYLAPAAAALVLLLVEGLRRLRVWRPRGKRIGLNVSRGVVAACLVTFLISVTLRATLFQRDPERYPVARALIAQQLRGTPGPDLVIVRYTPDYPSSAEWVYNAADIDAAPIVWAHDRGEAANRDLLLYFNGRRAWLLEPAFQPPRLTPLHRP